MREFECKIMGNQLAISQIIMYAPPLLERESVSDAPRCHVGERVGGRDFPRFSRWGVLRHHVREDDEAVFPCVRAYRAPAVPECEFAHVPKRMHAPVILIAETREAELVVSSCSAICARATVWSNGIAAISDDVRKPSRPGDSPAVILVARGRAPNGRGRP